MPTDGARIERFAKWIKDLFASDGRFDSYDEFVDGLHAIIREECPTAKLREENERLQAAMREADTVLSAASVGHYHGAGHEAIEIIRAALHTDDSSDPNGTPEPK